MRIVLTTGLKPPLSLRKSCGLGEEPVSNRLGQIEQGIYSWRDGVGCAAAHHSYHRVETPAQLAEVLRTGRRAGF
jgi:hypothetical protein